MADPHTSRAPTSSTDRSPEVLEASGYGEGLILATKRYVRDLLRVPHHPALAGLDLRTFVADSLDAGWITYFEP